MYDNKFIRYRCGGSRIFHWNMSRIILVVYCGTIGQSTSKPPEAKPVHAQATLEFNPFESA